MAFDSAPATPVQPAAPAMRDRNTFRLQPLRAARALRKLIADKEDTSQVFEIMRALSGNTIVRGYKRLLSTPQGGRLAYEREEFCERLSDTAWLNTFGPGTVGEAYRNFIAPRGLTAEGLAEESRKTAEGEIDAPHPFAFGGAAGASAVVITQTFPEDPHGAAAFSMDAGLRPGLDGKSTFGKTGRMTRAIQCLLTVALLFSSSTALADAPPVARAAPVTDSYFGEQVVDPYRWMEAVDTEFVDWARAQDAVPRRRL
eukprot:gene39461-53351_t